jgi:hypothetical protein
MRLHPRHNPSEDVVEKFWRERRQKPGLKQLDRPWESFEMSIRMIGRWLFRIFAFILLASAPAIILPVVKNRAWARKLAGADIVNANTMRAAIYVEYGAPSDVLESWSSVPIPLYTEHEIIVKVHASSINSVDWEKMNGVFEFVEKFTGDLPSTPGFDIAGTVVAVGSKCDRIKV